MTDNVNHPKHYTSHPSGIECIEITEHYCFTIGNAIKYLWRAGIKNEGSTNEIQDVQKAIWYVSKHLSSLRAKPRIDQGKPQEHPSGFKPEQITIYYSHNVANALRNLFYVGLMAQPIATSIEAWHCQAALKNLKAHLAALENANTGS